MTDRGHAAVIGGGTMGAGIASVLARAGIRTELIEVSEELADEAGARAREILDDGVARNRISPGDGKAAKDRIIARVGIENATPRPRIVIEAVPERVELKHEVLAAAEALEPELLASNTSGISIDRLAAGVADPSRFLGLHFFNPVAAMALVEVVIGSATSEQTREDGIALVHEIGKETVEIGDSPGFATSRLGLALGLEAIRMVEAGVTDRRRHRPGDGARLPPPGRAAAADRPDRPRHPARHRPQPDRRLRRALLAAAAAGADGRRGQAGEEERAGVLSLVVMSGRSGWDSPARQLGRLGESHPNWPSAAISMSRLL